MQAAAKGLQTCSTSAASVELSILRCGARTASIHLAVVALRMSASSLPLGG